MMNNLSKQPFLLRLANFISLICILAGAVMIGSAVFISIAGALLKVNITDSSVLLKALESVSASKNYLMIAQAATSTVSFILIPLLVIFFVWPDLKSSFMVPRLNRFQLVLLSVLILLSSIPIIAFLSEWNKGLHLPEAYKGIELWMIESEQEAEKLTNMMAYYDSPGELLAGLIVMALLPAIGEELLFRGILQVQFAKIFLNHHVAILITGFLFSFIHFQFFGFFPRMFLGVLFGYVFYWSGSLLFPVLMHFANNALTYIALNLYKKKEIDIDFESVNDLPVSSLLISLALCSVLLILFKKLSRQANE